ncbi:MAG TPA: DUF6636 domain-containing protein [Gaiellaceae bacterium]
MKALGVSLLAAALVATTASAAQQSYTTFKTPTGKIVCGVFIAGKYSESMLRCDILTGLKPKVKRPKGCDFDFGSTLELRPTGRAIIGCVSDAVGQAKRVLGYGQTFRKGPFTCQSARAGLTCKNKSGHGFFLSKQRWRRV